MSLWLDEIIQIGTCLCIEQIIQNESSKHRMILGIEIPFVKVGISH